MGDAGLAIKRVQVKKDNQCMEVMDATELVALSELGPQMNEAMRKMRETIHAIGSLDNVDFRELENPQELMYINSSLNLVYTVPTDLPYNSQGCGRDVIFLRYAEPCEHGRCGSSS